MHPADQPTQDLQPKSTLPVAADQSTEGQAALESTVDLTKEKQASVVSSPGHDFGDYELLNEIARGGMGVVFRARQKKANRIVALKMILSGGLADQEEVRRFYTEAEAAANLDHPNIVPVYDVGQINGQHYFSMGFVEGQSLSSAVREGPLEPRRAAELIKSVAEAIAYAHDQQIIHRDLKPANILLESNDRPRVTDFGLAKQVTGDSDLTASGQIMGTPSYMPPEQALGKVDEVGPLADVYSLGAVLYHLLTGHPPFRSASLMETLTQVVEQDPVSPRQLNPAIDLDLDTIVLKSLRKDPAKRYNSAQDLAEDLSRYLDRRPILARPVSTMERTFRWAMRNKMVASLLSLLVIGMISVTIASVVVANAMSQLASDRSDALDHANQANEKTRENLYVAEMIAGAEAANSSTGIERLATIVNKWLPEDDKPDLRGWEWYWLDSVSEREDVLIQTFPEGWASAPVPSADFSPDGSLIAWASSNEVQVAAVETLEVAARFNGDPNKLIFCTRFSHNGRRIAACGEDHKVRVWDVGSQQLVLEKDFGAVIGAVCFSADDRLVACQTNFANPASIYIVDVANDEIVKTLDTEIDGHLRTINFSRDGKWFASGGFAETKHFINVWNTTNWELHGQKHAHRTQIYAVAFSADSSRVASASADGSVKVWDLKSDEVTEIAPIGLGKTSLAWGPNDRYLAACGRDFSATIWDVESGETVDALRGHSSIVESVSWHAGEGFIATTGNDGFVRLWDMYRAPPVRSLKQLKTSEWHDEGYVSWSPDGKRVAAANSQPFTIWDAESGAPLLLNSVAEGSYTQLGGRPSWSSDGRFLVSSWAGTITFYNGEGTSVVKTLPSNGIEFLSFSPAAGDTRLAMTRKPSDSETTLLMFDPEIDAEPRKVASNLPAFEHFAWSPDGKKVCVSSGTTAFILDAESGKTLGKFTADSIIKCVAWSPNATQIVTGNQDHSATIWNATSLRAEEVLRGHTFAVLSVAWSPDGSRIATASSDNTVRLWNPTTKQTTMIFRHGDEVKHVAWSPNGRQLASMSQDAIVKIWDASRGYELEEQTE